MRGVTGWIVTAAFCVLIATPLRASEIYLCKDGRTVKVDSANRAQMLQDTCVKEWFDPANVTRAAATGGKGIGGESVRMTRFGSKR